MMRYFLSKLIPVRFRTEYGLVHDDGSVVQYRTTWWQFRDRIFRNHPVAL